MNSVSLSAWITTGTEPSVAANIFAIIDTGLPLYRGQHDPRARRSRSRSLDVTWLADGVALTEMLAARE